MARSKEQWKAQQRALHIENQSTNSLLETSDVWHSTPSMSSAPPVATKRLAVPVLKPEPEISYPRRGSSVQVIDLTLDDEEDEEEELIGTQVTQQVATTSTTSSSTTSGALKLSLLERTGNETAVATSKMMVSLVDDVESDVDEEWPRVPAGAASLASPSVVDDQAARNKVQRDVEVALNAASKTLPPSLGGHREDVLAQTDQVEVSHRQTLTRLYDDGEDEMEADVDEDLPNQVSKANEDTVRSPLTVDPSVQAESLEDGEIYEEGACLKPVMQVNRPKYQSGHVSAHLVEASGIRPHLRNKKPKKRGKKKSKRKLEAMQMMHAPPRELLPEYERTIRQRPFVDAPPPGQYTLAMMRNGSRGEPMSVRPVFQDVSPALFQSVGVPQAPLRPPLQHRPAPLPPPYDDSQILRVNRQGNMEMFDGKADLSRRTLFSKPLMYGGFKYRSVSVPSPSPVLNEPILPLQCRASDSSRVPSVPISNRGNATNYTDSLKCGEPGDFDLDSLRAAALRTKTKRSLKRTTETVTTTQSSLASSQPSAGSAHGAEDLAKPTSPEIDKLRLDILRSMRSRNRTASSREPNKGPLPSPQASAVNTNATEMNPSVGQADSRATKIVSQPMPTNSSSADANRIGTDGSSSNTVESTIVSEQRQANPKTLPEVATSSGQAKPSADFVVSTPEFRPLTASSQSLVIRLSPDDFSPRKSGDDARTRDTLPSSLQDAIKEMRRKIAEREKEQTNRALASAATRLSKQSCGSSAPSSPSPEKEMITAISQSSSTTAVSSEVSASAAESMKELSARAAVDELATIINVQSEAAQEEKEASPSSSAALLSAKAAAGQESLLKRALERKARSDTFGQGVTMTDSIEAEISRSGIVADKPVLRDEPVSEVELDFDAIRAEYQQCVIDCEEAEMHIARLSNEMAQLAKQLCPVESTVEGP